MMAHNVYISGFFLGFNRILIFTTVWLSLSVSSFAEGLLTNSNQSAQYNRMLSRNASTQTDAVYYNPAGLTKLDYGWHLSISNATGIGQNSVMSEYPYLNDPLYTGNANIYLLPSLYGAYRTEDLVISFGFGQTIADRSAFRNGIPGYEIGISNMKSFSELGIVGYSADIEFVSKSFFRGFQTGASYRFNEALSVYGGVRYVSGNNKYAGHINDIQARLTDKFVPAASYLSTMSEQLTGNISAASKVVDRLDVEMNDFGVANLSLLLLEQGGHYTSAYVEELLLGLSDLGVAAANPNWTVRQVRNEYNRLSNEMENKRKIILEKSTDYQDKNIDVVQRGSGWTPIMGICLSPSDNMVLSARYEYRTRLVLTNHSVNDETGLYPHNDRVQGGIPPLFAFGLGFQPVWWIDVQFSYNVFFDKDVGWGLNFREMVHNRKTLRNINDNTWELALGTQFLISDELSVSVGGLTSNPGVSDSYNSDLSFVNPSVSAALGFQWKVNDDITLDAGFMNIFYKDAMATYSDPGLPLNNGLYRETFGKTMMFFGFGFTYSLYR
jgi:long-chain fatty acid transport protein